MLVLSRKEGEEIVLPDCGVTIGIVKINGNAVRVGITAPSDIAIYRREVAEGLRLSPNTRLTRTNRP